MGTKDDYDVCLLGESCMIHIPNLRLYEQEPKLMTKIWLEKIMRKIGVILTTNFARLE